MGAIVRATCSCGYATGFTAGSGAGGPDGGDVAPALCRTCRRVVTVGHPAPRCGRKTLTFEAVGCWS